MTAAVLKRLFIEPVYNCIVCVLVYVMYSTYNGFIVPGIAGQN